MTVGVAAQLDLPDLDARKWHFPKEFHAETTFDESKIYPQRAPDGGGAKGRVIDNRWITPCAPPLPPAAFMYAVSCARRARQSSDWSGVRQSVALCELATTAGAISIAMLASVAGVVVVLPFYSAAR